jgi:hypothetical protein
VGKHQACLASHRSTMRCEHQLRYVNNALQRKRHRFETVDITSPVQAQRYRRLMQMAGDTGDGARTIGPFCRDPSGANDERDGGTNLFLLEILPNGWGAAPICTQRQQRAAIETRFPQHSLATNRNGVQVFVRQRLHRV